MAEQETIVYLVVGETGEYSDHRTWFVRVLQARDEADAFTARLNAWCEEQGVSRGVLERATRRPNWGHLARIEKEGHPLDPHFDLDYTGTSYSVAEVPFGVLP